MAQLIVRKVDEKLVRELKQRAGEHGIPMEEEHRRILRDALELKPRGRSFKDHLRAMPEIPEKFLKRKKDLGRRVEL